MKKINCAWIIDDDPIFLFYMQRIMNSLHVFEDIKNYTNGKKALKDIKKAFPINNTIIPDIIFLDLNMPVMDGWQFLDEIRKIEKRKEIVIYIVTSSVDPIDREKATSYEFVEDYIVKPVKADNLKNVISEYLENFV